jgi:hypothetical protein
MKESTTYQKILREGRAEGRAEEAKRILKRQGSRRFGTLDADIEAALWHYQSGPARADV